MFTREQKRIPSPGSAPRRRIEAMPSFSPPSGPLSLRKVCPCGGGCSTCTAARQSDIRETAPALQAKLAIGPVDDPLEQEADRVADHVTAIASPPQAQASNEASSGIAQRKPMHSDQLNSPALPEPVRDTLRSPGQPLDAETRAFMEPRFNQDFSTVRVHTDAKAAKSAQNLNAHAYTLGHQIAFDAGAFAPNTHAGRRLIAHELTHVVQQQNIAPGAAAVQRDSKKKPADSSGNDDDVLFEIFVGDGKHQPNDVSFAIKTAKADAKRLRAAGSLSRSDRLDLNAKMKFFEPPALQAYAREIKPALEDVTREEIDMEQPDPAKAALPLDRDGMLRQIPIYMDGIQKVKAARIHTWSKTEESDAAKPSSAALEVALVIVAGGIGGVVGGLLADEVAALVGKDAAKGAEHISHGGHDPLEEFTYLVGLEAADQASEAAFHRAIDGARETLGKGTKAALESRKESVKTALATDPNDGLLECYTEAVTLQSIEEQVQDGLEFNKTASTLSDVELAGQYVVYKTLYENLMASPDAFLRELTVGYIRLMEEAYLETEDKKFGGDRARTRQAMHKTWGIGWRQPGYLNIEAVGLSEGLGDWGNPNLSINLGAAAVDIHTRDLDAILNTPLKDLPLTMRFYFRVRDPIYRIHYGSEVTMSFERDPDGTVYFPGAGDTASEEWLASYYLGSPRANEELSDSERAKYAPLGARMLYEAMKDKKIVKTFDLDDFGGQ
jgi:hypothetical protein